MHVLPISGGMTSRQVDLITDFQPEVICCSPSYALTIAEEMMRRGLDTENCSLKYAVLGSEAWTEAIRDHVEATLGVEATNIYGLGEIIGRGVANGDGEEKGGPSAGEDHFSRGLWDQ